MKIKDLLNRFDKDSINGLCPYGSAALVSLICLRKDFLDGFQNAGPKNLLLEKNSLSELFSVMKESEARDLLKQLSICSDAPYESLRKIAFSPSEKQKEIIFRYFGYEEAPQKNMKRAKSTIPIEAVAPSYGLYPYQRKALEDVEKIFEKTSRVLLQMPTGAGKTRTAMALACRFLSKNPKALVIWLANTAELCEQAKEEFKKSWSAHGDYEANVYAAYGSSNLDFAAITCGFLVMSLQTANSQYTKGILKGKPSLSLLQKHKRLVIFDEAHQAEADTYKLILEFLAPLLAQGNSNALGLSATPGRATNSSDPSNESLRQTWQGKLVKLKIDGYDTPIEYLQKEGYLAHPHFRSVGSKLNLTRIFQEFGYRDDQALSSRKTKQLEQKILQVVANDKDRDVLIFEEIQDLLQSHKRVLLFAASVEQSERLAFVSRFAGFHAQSLTQENLSTERRKEIIDWYKDNSDEHKLLCNFGILTTGFDAPQTSAVIIARPTDSLVLYSQMIGRGLRGKKSGGNSDAEIVTIIDQGLPSFWDVEKAFKNWDSIWR